MGEKSLKHPETPLIFGCTVSSWLFRGQQLTNFMTWSPSRCAGQREAAGRAGAGAAGSRAALADVQRVQMGPHICGDKRDGAARGL